MANSMISSKGRQSGAAAVEAALIIVIFLVLVLGIIEFAMLIFNASSLVEATRAGARYLIVNEPVVDRSELSDCANMPVINCGSTSGASCDGVVALMQKFYPRLTADNVEITYSCSSTGYSESYFYIYDVELRLVGVQYQFITPGILGFSGYGDRATSWWLDMIALQLCCELLETMWTGLVIR